MDIISGLLMVGCILLCIWLRWLEKMPSSRRESVEPKVIGSSKGMYSFLVKAQSGYQILHPRPFVHLPYGTVITKLENGLYQVDVETTGVPRPTPEHWHKAHGTIGIDEEGAAYIEVWRDE